MLINLILYIISSTTAPNPADLSIISGITHTEAQKQINLNYPIYAYANDSAIYLTQIDEAPPVGATLLARKINPNDIAIIWLRSKQPLIVTELDYPLQIRILYQEEKFAIIEADRLGQDMLQRSGLEVTPLRQKTLAPARTVQFPNAPEGLQITHASLSNITPEKVMGYDQTLANFISRFTFDYRLLNAQEWSRENFHTWGLLTTDFPYNALYSITHFYGIKQETELASYFGFIYRKENGSWVTYHANIMILDTKYSTDGSHLYLCGRGGLVGWNTLPNDYNNWTIKDTGVEKDLYGIYAEGDRIWAVGKQGTIVYSSNGGDTWQIIPSGITVDTLEEVGKFHVGTGSDQKYFIVGGSGAVLRSDDGINWIRLPNVPLITWLRDICGYENPTGIPHGEIMVVGGDGAIMTSPDGGNTWNPATTGTGTWMHCGHYAGRSWVEGTNGSVAISDDYGQTWTDRSTVLWNLLTNMSFPTDGDINKCYMCGQYNAYMKTADGGITWQFLPCPYSNYQAVDLIAELPGTKYPDQIIIVCAHEDSISDNPYLAAPGADDNGTGSSAVMAIAEEMSKMTFERTVRFILFSGEEQGLLGSRAYADQMVLEGQNIIAVLNADMIGYMDDAIPDFDLLISGTGAELQSFVAACAAYYSPQTPIHIQSGGLGGSDHQPFAEDGYQAILLIEHKEEQWYPYYHTQHDLPEYVSADLVARGTKILLGSAMELAVPLGGRSGVNQNLPYAYPNPLHKDKGWENITFTNLVPGAKVTVYNLNGDTVWSDTATNSTLIWQSTKVAAGIYLYNINQNGKKYKGKLAVIR